MFRTANATKYHLTVLAGLLILVVSTIASAATSTTDLGKNQPNTPDLSLRAPWHIYVFHRDNVEYVQINDVNNNVRAAFAYANGQTLVLPMGADAVRVSVQQQSKFALRAAGTSEMVYHDNQLQVVMTPQQAGTSWVVQTTNNAAEASECTIQHCTGLNN